MASTLRSKAIKNLGVGNTSAYYSYVEEKNGTNPVIQQLEKELGDFMGFVKKKHAGHLNPGEHPPCRVSDALFDIWNKFEPRVTQRFFYQKLMDVGEYLVKNKEYATASWQCYDRYLNHFAELNFNSIQTIEDIRTNFFAGNTNQENSDVTFRALMGHCICVFHFTVGQDPKLLNNNTIFELNETLRCLRLIMTLQLETEHYCWLVYNATIYTYSISRYMMQYGYSKQVLEYLLFCCLAMESSIPLMGIKYLSWRSTLYAITCQCYYDCKFHDDGELFARRALSKVNELYELELASMNGEDGIKSPQFREATIKIGTYLFKRLVYESRRKGKGQMRTKVRINFKDIINQQWPRTQTERLLAEMFDCSSAQFLAIEEALNETNRRIAMPMPAANESEFENLDVVVELLLAAEYIANGGNRTTLDETEMYEYRDVYNSNASLIQMAINAESGVQLRNFLKVVKFAFNYEAWDIFRRLSTKLINIIESSPDLYEQYQADVHIIQLLQAIDKYLIQVRRQRHIKNETIKANYNAAKEKAYRNETATTGNHGTRLETAASLARTEISRKESKASKLMSGKVSKMVGTASNKNMAKLTTLNDESGTIKENMTEAGDTATSAKESVREDHKEEDLLLNIATKVMDIMETKIATQRAELDVIVDSTLILWRKCKEVFSKHQTGSDENYRWVLKLENFGKWLYILNVVHEAMIYFDISTIDPAVFAHCSLRLGLIYESLANINQNKKLSGQMEEAHDQLFRSTKLTSYTERTQQPEVPEEYIISNDVHENLLKAKIILKKALFSISQARASISKSDKTCLCDKDYGDNTTHNLDELPTKTSTCEAKYKKLKSLKEKIFAHKKESQSDSVSNLIADLHVELIYLFHKISMRLLGLNREYNLEQMKPKHAEKEFEKEFDLLFKSCRRNKVSISLLLLSKASFLYQLDETAYAESARDLLQRAFNKLVTAEEEDKSLFDNHVKQDSTILVKAKVPPAPIVCQRTFNKIVVQPRKFEQVDGQQASWYRIFASQMTSVNSKARISDFTFPGSGEQIPANNCDYVTISGLNSDEKYIFAVAAYDKTGELISNSIGDSTEPILASNSLSILMNWSFLCQMAYQINEHELAITAFEKLWHHFIIKPVPPPSQTFVLKNEVDLEVTFHQLNYEVVSKTSPLLLRKFLECFFINAEIKTRQKKIFCDTLFDGKIHYNNQIERIHECEKILVAVELASWLNDPMIILQAIVQCYGFLAPLIYYSVAYEPVVEILAHCMLVLEEVPYNTFQRKSKSIFESLQHMIACTTYFLTDVLKRFNRKSLSNYLNLIGRKLLGLDDSGHDTTSDDMQDSNDMQPELQNKLTEKATRTKFNELKALESYLARTNANNKSSIFNMLTGNEDNTQIYAFIHQNVTRYSFKELIKFRKRHNYFELLINLLQKALTEDLNGDINEWCTDTLNWLTKRNVSIVGASQIMVKKTENFLAAKRNSFDSDMPGDTVSLMTTHKLKEKAAVSKKRQIKKYKLLIPIDLSIAEKAKLEEKQKCAINVLYDLFPERHENWQKRIKLRRIFTEESAYKSQFYAIWALNSFSLLMTRINQSSPQNRMNYLHRLGTSSYLDPQQFLFDKNNALIVSDEAELDTLSILGRNKAKKTKKTTQMTQGSKMSLIGGVPGASNSRTGMKSSSNSSITQIVEERLHELKDTAEILMDTLTNVIEPADEFKPNFSISESTASDAKVPQAPISSNDFAEMSNQVFNKFRRAVVIAHRYKQWTQLQNVCKLMFNCVNQLLHYLPGVSFNNRRLFRLNDIWKSVCPCMYLAAENLLDMLFYTIPMDSPQRQSLQNQLNKWFTSGNIGKTGGTLKFDIALDNITSVDLRFVKDFIFRSLQCLAHFDKSEKLLSVALKFNAMTNYKYAEFISPLVLSAQNKLLRQLELNGNSMQPHFTRLKAEIGRYPRIEDMFFLNFKVELDPSCFRKDDAETIQVEEKKKKDENRAKELISVPLDVKQSTDCFEESLGTSDYNSRQLVHARRLLSLYLLSQTSHYEFYGIGIDSSNSHKGNDIVDIKEMEPSINDDEPTATTKVSNDFETYENSIENSNKHKSSNLNEFFHVNPINYYGRKFDGDNKEVLIKDVNINLKVLIESYDKAIKLLLSHNEKDLAVQALHELGNIFHFNRDIPSAYRYWNEALDTLLGVKNCIVQWRREFYDEEAKCSNTEKILEKCGIWGCLLGGVLTSKMAQYYLANDLEIKTECCLFSATLFKSIFRSSVSYSKHDLDYAKEDADFLNIDFLLPGFLFNSEMYRFDIRYVVSSLNFICLELLYAGHYINILPAVSLLEYFSRTVARDLTQTVFARLIKVEALSKMNRFNEAIVQLNRLTRGERLPHSIDDRFVNIPNNQHVRYTEFFFDASKPIFELNNLRCLETVLSVKLSKFVSKLFGPHLTCRYYLVQTKLFVQIASCLPCIPNLKEFYDSQLFKYTETNNASFNNPESAANIPKSGFTGQTKRTKDVPNLNPPTNTTSINTTATKITTLPQTNTTTVSTTVTKTIIVKQKPKEIPMIELRPMPVLDDNPDVLKVFSKIQTPLSLEFIKSCLLGTAKTIVLKCTKSFAEDFPTVDKYVVSSNWQREFKYECNMLLASISDQCQLNYLALQNVVEAMKELSIDSETKKDKEKVSLQLPKIGFRPQDIKQSKLVKKGAFQFFDLTAKSHLNSRLWLKARVLFIQYMFNQLNDAGKAKGVDENIISDFGDLNYYCDKCLSEADKFYDSESKAYIQFVDASLDLIRGVSLQSCLSKLMNSLRSFLSCNQLSLEGLLNYLKCQIMIKDVSFAVSLIGNNQAAKEAKISQQLLIEKAINDLVDIERTIFDQLRVSGGESVQCYVDKSKSYFNTLLANIKNLYNPLLFYLCQTKSRLGSSLVQLASFIENDRPTDKLKPQHRILHALNVLSIGIELNKVICERSINVEIELSYKQTYCMKELYMKHKVCTLNDVVDGYNNILKLLYNSTHDLALTKQCYLELAIVFISIMEPSIVHFNTQPNMAQGLKVVSALKKNPVNRNSPQYKKAAEASLTALEFAIKCTSAMKEKMLLPGHKSIKEMSSMNVTDGPVFVVNDLLGYYVMADRKKVYRDKIEEEADNVNEQNKRTYDQKVAALEAESNQSITWVHLLNYQTKMQNINSMRNLNTLKNGRNRNKFSDLFTIGLTPTMKSTHYLTARLSQLNFHMKQHLPVYQYAMAPLPVPEFFKAYSKTLSTFKQSLINAQLVSEYVVEYEKNQAVVVNNATMFEKDKGKEEGLDREYSVLTDEITMKSATSRKTITYEVMDWTYLQQNPCNFYHDEPDQLKLSDLGSSESIIDYLFTFNWYKPLSVSDKTSSSEDDRLIALIATKEPVAGNKVKFRFLSAEAIHELHCELSPLATIADTTLQTMEGVQIDLETLKKTNGEFLNSLRKCLDRMAELFEKETSKEDKKTFPFDLTPSNICDLEKMLNTKFGGFTQNESLKNYLFNLFITEK